MQITITITANKDDAADFINNVIGGETVINPDTTGELEKALAENREETINAWLVHAKRTLRKIAENLAFDDENESEGE